MRPVLVVRTALFAVVALLAGCGMLVPDQDVDNPLGLDGATLAIEIDGDPLGVTTLLPLAFGSATATAGFADIDSPISPTTFAIEQPLQSTAYVTTSGDYPATIVLDDAILLINISDAQNATNIELEPNATVTLTHQGAGTYSVSSSAFSIELSGSPLNQLNPILTGGGTNTVFATLTVEATSTPDLPAGSVITITLGGGTGTIGF